MQLLSHMDSATKLKSFSLWLSRLRLWVTWFANTAKTTKWMCLSLRSGRCITLTREGSTTARRIILKATNSMISSTILTRFLLNQRAFRTKRRLARKRSNNTKPRWRRRSNSSARGQLELHSQQDTQWDTSQTEVWVRSTKMIAAVFSHSIWVGLSQVTQVSPTIRKARAQKVVWAQGNYDYALKVSQIWSSMWTWARS